MRKVLFVLVILSTTLPLFGQFRGTEWGMSRVQVIEIEGEPVVNNEEFIAYEGSIAGYETYTYFTFIEDQLTAGNYYLIKTYTNRNKYIEQYKEMKSNLINVYGEPKSDDMIWNGSLYKGDTDNYGMAIAVGDLEYQTVWSTDETKILHKLFGNNYEITHSIYYESLEHQDLINEEQNKSSTEGL